MGNFKWYMVRCVTGKEEKAIENLKFELENASLSSYVDEIMCPKDKKYFMRSGKKISRDVIMFPGYFLINVEMIGEIPRVIKNTNLVSQIMGDGNGRPESLKQTEVDRIYGNVEKAQEEIKFLQGEEVAITDGPFKNFTGTVREINHEKERMTVDVMVFGNPTPIELNYMQVDKAKVNG